MRKRDEISDMGSCLNKAREDEWLFVLLGRDKAAPAAVRAWIDERLRIGKNKPTDAQIVEAEAWIEKAAKESGAAVPKRAAPEPLYSVDGGPAIGLMSLPVWNHPGYSIPRYRQEGDLFDGTAAMYPQSLRVGEECKLTHENQYGALMPAVTIRRVS
jgi:hypothetical protein